MKVKALGIILSSIFASRAMKCNKLVSQNIISGSNARRDLDHPAVAVGNQLVVSPSARDLGAVHQTDAIDLEKLQGILVHGLTGLAAVGQVVNHRAMMGIRPLGPLQVDPVSGRNHRMPLGVGGVEMANDIGCSILG